MKNENSKIGILAFDCIKELTVNTKKKTYVRKNTYAKLRKKHNIIKKDILKLVNRD